MNIQRIEYFNNIPNELLFYLFSYVEKPEPLAQVCKLWKQISESIPIWQIKVNNCLGSTQLPPSIKNLTIKQQFIAIKQATALSDELIQSSMYVLAEGIILHIKRCQKVAEIMQERFCDQSGCNKRKYDDFDGPGSGEEDGSSAMVIA